MCNSAPDSSPSELLLPDCIHFSCCSPIALIHFNCCSPFVSASAAARHFTCVCFSCYSPIASVSTAPRLRPLRLLLLDRVHRKFNCCSGFTCSRSARNQGAACSSPIACASAAAPRLRLLRLLLPDCIRLRLRDPRAVGVARQFVQPHFSRTESKLAKSNLLDTKQGG